MVAFVSLRPISRADYPQLFAWRSSFDSVHLLNFRRRIGAYEEFVREFESLLPNVMFLFIRDSRDTPIGYALAHNMNPWDRWLTVAMYVDEKYRNRGHGAEAAMLATDFLFSIFPLERILTEVYEFATDLLRMIELLGFEQFGFLPEHFFYRGSRWGVHQMLLTRSRWLVHRERFADILSTQDRFERLST